MARQWWVNVHGPHIGPGYVTRDEAIAGNAGVPNDGVILLVEVDPVAQVCETKPDPPRLVYLEQPTLRDHFAMAAPAPTGPWLSGHSVADGYDPALTRAAWAYAYADAMLDVRGGHDTGSRMGKGGRT